MTDDARLLREDEQARIDALDVGRSFIVQAPAGSGKTELLIQRYLRLLAIVDNPEEIIAITFTRKAAAEMKVRVLQALQRAQSAAGDPSGAHEKITAEAARAALHRDRSCGWQLLHNTRRMRIQTLDSLNASIARMQPLTAGASAGNRLVGDAESKRIYRGAAAATLDWLTERGAERSAIRNVLRHLDNNTGLYVRYLARMLETRDQWLPFIGGGQVDGAHDDLRQNLEHNLQQVVSEHLETLRIAFPPELVSEVLGLAAYAARNLVDAGCGEHVVVQLAELDALPGTEAGALQQWLALAEFLLTAKGDWRRRVTRNQGFPPGDDGQKDALSDAIDALSRCAGLANLLRVCRQLPPLHYADEQWSVLLALFRLLPLAVAELKRLFRDQRVTDYIDIALAAEDAIGTAEQPGDMALLLDYQVRHILVDEMQDTSRAQYRMLEALTGGWQEGDGRTLFCVGDPMQSIYRFRNAEVAQFLLAQTDGIGSVTLRQLRLRRNFRSGEFLVHWFNTVFPAALPMKDDPARGAVSYSEAVPGLRDGGDCRTYPVFGANPAAEADQALSIIETTLSGIEDDESMALLVRSRTQLAALLPRLRQAGIRWQAVDIDRLTDLPEIIDLLALTRSLVHPCDRLAWLALLRSPWIGWSWNDLYELVRNERSSTIPELLGDPQRIERLSADARASYDRVRPIIDALPKASRSLSLRERVERAWFQLRGPAILEDATMVENAYRFLDVLGTLEVAGTLQDVADLEAQLDQERVSGDADARLQIMTMHRAKGLQFDHVLLMGLGRVPRRRERSVLSWYDRPGHGTGDDRIVSPVGPRHEVQNDPIHRFIEYAEDEKDRHESARLLYVACTRARKSLHLLGHTGISRDGNSIRPADSRSLLGLIWEMVEPQFEAAFDTTAVTETDDPEPWLTPARRRIDDSWQLPESGVIPGQHRAIDGAEAAHRVEYYWVGAEARAAGTVVHRWLQLAAGGRVNLEQRMEFRATSEAWLAELGVGPEGVDTVLQRVDRALQNVLADPRGRWLLKGDGHTEFALTGLIDGEVRSGVIDRVRVDDDGTHWIVDYKTGTHEGGDLDHFLAAESERYRPQLARYAALYRGYSGKSARCALYFPLLQAFVEVDL